MNAEICANLGLLSIVSHEAFFQVDQTPRLAKQILSFHGDCCFVHGLYGARQETCRKTVPRTGLSILVVRLEGARTLEHAEMFLVLSVFSFRGLISIPFQNQYRFASTDTVRFAEHLYVPPGKIE